jgi:hypothetical protein
MHTLYRLVALLAFVASVLGCDHPHRTISQRTTANGVDQLDSEVEITTGHTRFDCHASRTGACHYTVFAHPCDEHDRCDATPLRQLSVQAGTQQDLTGLPAAMQVCASADATPVDARCHPLASSS